VTFLAPIALVALLVPAAIYLVHWLFGSRRRLRVSALFLWADLPNASMGRSRRRWPPITLLLLLQLLVAVLAALALARPATPSDPPRHLALILDASASMQSTDVAPTRFDAARARGVERLAALRPSDQVSLIRAGRDATLLSSGSPDSARDALNAARPGASGSAIREALALASSQIAATPERHGQIVLLSDVAWPTPGPVGPLAATVEVVAVGGGSDNQAVSNLQVRMDPNGRAQTAFVEIANFANHPVRVPMRLSADGAPLDERQVDIPARARSRLSIPLPVTAHHITARLLGHDSLALDDVAETNAPGGPPRDVVVLGRVTDGLRRALESIPSLHVRPPDASVIDPADLTVLAGSLPARLPTGPLLLVDPPSNSGRLLGVGLGNGARVQESHPLLQGLDLAAMQSETPSVGGVPGWAHVVLGTLDGPLIMEGRLEGQPVVALTFDPSLSGLEKSLAFPLLISNATSFLLTQSDPTSAAVAEPFDPAKSDIAPRPIPSLSSSNPSVLTTEGIGERWQWALVAALVVLGVEWLVFARRG
jgi:VWA domain-containing protein/aerotolerance regulator-like protein